MEQVAGIPGMYEASEQTFLRKVFAWMLLGLAVTGVSSALIGSDQAFLDSLTQSPAFMLIFVAQIGLVLAISWGINKISATVAFSLFMLYSALNGFMFALIFSFYTSQSIFTTFLIAGAMFGAMAIIGYTTKADLSKMGTIMFMGLIGLIIATIVNVFVANSALYWITTYAGVIIFCGLTAYDMQKLKQIGDGTSVDNEQGKKLAVFGALSLYLDFINLFLFLLRIFGNSR